MSSEINFVIKTGLGMELKRIHSLEKAIVWINKFGTEKQSTHRKLLEKRWQIFCIHCSQEIDFRNDISYCICSDSKQYFLEELKIEQ